LFSLIDQGAFTDNFAGLTPAKIPQFWSSLEISTMAMSA
jgi:hypothetical protein